MMFNLFIYDKDILGNYFCFPGWAIRVKGRSIRKLIYTK
jgi:hypothetical protein